MQICFFSIYSMISAPTDTGYRRIMIRTIEEFCQGYFHMDDCFEWNQPKICICRDLMQPPKWCVRSVVRGVAHLLSGPKTLYLQKYSNEFKGSSEENVHVEEFVIQDETLKKIILDDSIPNKKLILYISYQPCHHSSGGRSSGMKKHGKSCTNLLVKWNQDLLIKHGIDVVIKCCGLYRVHWEDENGFRNQGDVEIFKPKAGRAKEGLMFLMREPNIRLEAMTPEDWWMFMRYCGDTVRKCMTMEFWQKRHKYDENIRDFLQSVRDSYLTDAGEADVQETDGKEHRCCKMPSDE